MEGTEMEHKKSKTQRTPFFRNAFMIPAREPTLHYKESKLFKTAFSQPTAKSPYYGDYTFHMKIKPYKGEENQCVQYKF